MLVITKWDENTPKLIADAPNIPGREMKAVVRIGNLHEMDEDAENLAWWLSRPIEERIGAVEYLRNIQHGEHTRVHTRLQRTLEIVPLDRS
jgi:hypothetical protein